MDHQPLHILLVEDDDVHATIVQRGFRSTGNDGTIDRVADGVDAVAYVRRQGAYQDRPQPDMILLDLKLPRMDGHDVLRTLKNDAQWKWIPVVILTTSDAPKDVLEAYRCHANSYLIKPVSFTEFKQMIGALASYWGQWNRPPLIPDSGA